MIQITIKKQNVITNQAIFETQELADSWLAYHVEANSFGLAAREEQIIIDPYVFATFDDDGILLTEEIPAVYETINHIAEYTIEQEDISDSLAQEMINADALAYLSSTDWKVIRALEKGEKIPQDTLDSRQSARDSITKLSKGE